MQGSRRVCIYFCVRKLLQKQAGAFPKAFLFKLERIQKQMEVCLGIHGSHLLCSEEDNGRSFCIMKMENNFPPIHI
jgi:hypothetical protein